MLRAALEHIVFEADKLEAKVQRVLSAHQVEIVVPLIVVGSDIRGAVARVADRRVAREGIDRQSNGKGIVRINYAGNVELRGGSQPRIRPPAPSQFLA
jgi:hypothetical protein